ncbi:hypothetical protein VNI00_012373 [Paramarasmius palmivorus]|uniref:Uncharacterized protein n=1 Tax=Paramarasmius palmivorus TaxID=297713 RepID=A0AAW0C7Q2_9AGAR
MICSCRRRILLTHFKLWESASHSYSTRPKTGRTRQELIQILDDICSSSQSEHPVLPPQPTSYNHNRNSQKTPHELLEDLWEASERHVEERKTSGKPKARIDREKVGMFGQHGWVREQNERESKAKGKERAKNWVLEAHEAARLARNKEFVFNSAKEDENGPGKEDDEDSGLISKERRLEVTVNYTNTDKDATFAGVNGARQYPFRIKGFYFLSREFGHPTVETRRGAESAVKTIANLRKEGADLARMVSFNHSDKAAYSPRYAELAISEPARHDRLTLGFKVSAIGGGGFQDVRWV